MIIGALVHSQFFFGQRRLPKCWAGPPGRITLSRGFDWKWVDQFHPDEVWFMPTERYAFCTAKPAGIPEAPQQALAWLALRIPSNWTAPPVSRSA